MRQLAKYLIGFVLLVVFCWLGTRTYRAYSAKKEAESRIQTLQHDCFESLTGKSICLDDFNTGQPTVILYFHPDCEHCQYEATEIGMNAELFKNTNMLMVTPDDSVKRIEAFASRYHLEKVDNLAILIDRKAQFKNYFGSTAVPSAYIYGKDRKLIKMFKGEVQIKAIAALIK